MYPFKLTYQVLSTDPSVVVDVYNIQATFDLEGNITETYVTAWNQNTKQWLTAPLYCFYPVKQKILKEGEN